MVAGAGSSSLLGGAVGSVLGTVTGLIQGIEQKRMAKKIRKQIRGGIEAGEFATARQVGTILTSKEYQTASNFLRSFYGLSPLTGGEIGESMLGAFGHRVASPFASPEHQRAVPVRGASPEDIAFMQQRLAGAGVGVPGTGGRGFGPTPGGPIDVLSQEFSKGLQQTQAARGLFSSQAAAAAEASGLAGLRAQLQIQMLPQLFELAQAPVAYAQQYQPMNLQKEVFRSTGGAAAYGQATPLAAPVSVASYAAAGAMQGFAQGAGIGLSAYQLSQTQQSPNVTASTAELDKQLWGY